VALTTARTDAHTQTNKHKHTKCSIEEKALTTARTDAHTQTQNTQHTKQKETQSK